MNYRAIPNKDNRAIAGLSMGGRQTLAAAKNNPGVFGDGSGQAYIQIPAAHCRFPSHYFLSQFGPIMFQ
jgi:hypothetical protein